MFKLAPEDSVKRLDLASSLLHRYNFALVGDRDYLVRRAYKIVAELSLDIALLNVPSPCDGVSALCSICAPEKERK